MSFHGRFFSVSSLSALLSLPCEVHDIASGVCMLPPYEQVATVS